MPPGQISRMRDRPAVVPPPGERQHDYHVREDQKVLFQPSGFIVTSRNFLSFTPNFDWTWESRRRLKLEDHYDAFGNLRDGTSDQTMNRALTTVATPACVHEDQKHHPQVEIVLRGVERVIMVSYDFIFLSDSLLTSFEFILWISIFLFFSNFNFFEMLP